MAGSKPIVAVFDFDGTITYADSFLPFLRHLSGRIGFWSGMLGLSPALLAHATGRLANWETKERFLIRFVKGRRPEDLAGPAREFVEKRLPRLINPRSMEQVEWHRAQGHRLLLLSASPEIYLRHWADSNGFEKALGTRLEEADGIFTGRIAGRNCHGEEKIARLRGELGELSDYEIYSYGDSRSDRPLLERVDHGVYRGFEGRSRLVYRLRAMTRFASALL